MDVRHHKICPVPGCHAKPQAKLSQHIKVKHTQYDRSERLAMVVKASRATKSQVGHPTIRSTRGQPSITSSFFPAQPDEAPMLGIQERLGAGKSGTRTFPRFPINSPTILLFKKHLMNVDGKERTSKVAHEMCVDISKFLKYATDPLATKPVWNHLLNRKQVLNYFTELDQAVGVDGKLSKLDTFEAALKFLRATTYKLDSEAYKESTHMSEVMLGWEATWRKKKSIKRAVRQEMVSTDGLEMDDLNKLIDHTPIWDLFVDACDKVMSGLPITAKLMDECSTIISIPLTFRYN